MMIKFLNVFGTAVKKLVRRNDPETSHEAAQAVNTTKLEREVYEAIKGFPEGCISDDVVALFPASPYSSITARYKALSTKGLIEFIGTRRAKSGRNQRVMKAI
jgi:hypothetical protein